MLLRKARARAIMVDWYLGSWQILDEAEEIDVSAAGSWKVREVQASFMLQLGEATVMQVIRLSQWAGLASSGGCCCIMMVVSCSCE